MVAIIRLHKLLGFLVLTIPMLAWAQPLPPTGFDELLKERTKYSDIYNKALRGEGEFDAKNKELVAAIDANARYYSYRVTRPEFQMEPGKMDSAFREFESVLKQLKNKPNTPFNSIFISKLLEHTSLIFPNTSINARINAVRMQSMAAAEIGYCDFNGQKALPDQFMESLVAVVQKGQDDGMKLYALKGIRETYKALRPLATVKKSSNRIFLNPATETKVAETLANLIETPTVYPAGTAPEIVEGYRVLRREAIKALAQSRTPLVGKKGKTALILAKIAAGVDVKPEPRLDEKVEAAIGLLNLRPELEDPNEYNLDAAVFQFGSFLVDFFQRYNSRNDSDAEKLFPWKFYAARITDALEEVRRDVKNPYLEELLPKVVGGLNDMEKTEKGAVPQLAGFLQSKPPMSMLIYKKIPGTEVKAPGS